MELKFWWPHNKFVPPSWSKMPVNNSFVIYRWVGWGGCARSHLKSFHSEYSLWGYIKNFIILSHFGSTTVLMQPHPQNSLCYAYLGNLPRWTDCHVKWKLFLSTEDYQQYVTMRWFVRLADLLSPDMCPRSQVRSQIKLHCFTLSNVWCLALVSNDDSTNLNNCM